MFSRRLINEYLERPLSFDEMREALVMLGMPVENVHRKTVAWTNVVVGQVLAMGKHPNADRLHLLKVTDGQREYAIVCGAHNMKEGDKVALAKIGAELPGGVKIRKTKIRDVTSEGMCCSLQELALSEEPSEGIAILDPGAPLGRPVEELLADDDETFDVEVTTNRPDCLGLMGLARELAAKLQIGLRVPQVSSHPADRNVPIQIEDDKGCPRYAGALIRGVSVKESPDWLKQKLLKCGIRPINNVVDVTNFVLLETSHPIHAFDLARLQGGCIIVRRARDEEMLQTLDVNMKLQLTKDDLMICDANHPVALAGIMGGEESGIQNTTTDVVIECAMFDPVSVRKSGQRHAIRSEAGFRFERGCDETAIPRVLDRAIDLMLEMCGGRLDGLTDLYPNPTGRREIRFSISECRRLVGISFERADVESILRRLGFDVEPDGEDVLKVRVPGYRLFDISTSADLVEEVARVHGYEKIPYAPLTVAVRYNLDKKKDKRIDEYPALKKEAFIKDLLLGFGFYEAMNYSFISSALLDQMTANAFGGRILLREPLSQDQDILRPTLYCGLLQNVRDNLNRGAKEVRLFEIGTVFSEGRPAVPSVEKTPLAEEMKLAAVFARGDVKMLWKDEQRDASVFDMKGILDALFRLFRIEEISYRNIEGAADAFYHPGINSGVYHKNEAIAHVGAFHPRVMKLLDIEEEIFGFEIDLGFLLPRMGRKKFVEYSVFQSVTQDISFTVDESVTNQMILDVIEGEKIDLIRNCYCFDIFHGSKLPEGKKSMAYSVTYQHPSRTLTQDEVNEVHERVVRALEKRLDIRLRI